MNGWPSLDEIKATWGRPPDSPLEAAVLAVMRAYTILIGAHEAAYADLELSVPRFAVLGTLDRSEDGTMTMSALARVTFLSPPTLTYTLDHLEGRGLVRRRPGPGDKRQIMAEITLSGRTIIRESYRRMAELSYGVLGLSRADAEQVTRLLAKIEGSPSDIT